MQENSWIGIVVGIVALIVGLAAGADALAGLGLIIGVVSVAVAPTGQKTAPGSTPPAPTPRQALAKAQEQVESTALSASQGVSTHTPAAPVGTVIEPWSAVRRGVEVVGETYRPGSFRRLFRGVPQLGQYSGAELNLAAALVDDHDNPFGNGDAVAVFVGGVHVGYLSNEDARRYFPAVSSARAVGKFFSTPARVWACTASGRMVARVTLSLPEPEGMVPANGLPSVPHVVLPTGSTIKVTKTDEHVEELSALLDKRQVVDVAATLHRIHEIRPRSAYEAVEVRVNDKPIGVLSKVSSDHMLPIVKYIAERGMLSVARAVLRGNELKVDMTLYVAKSHDIDQSWIASLGSTNSAATADRDEFGWDDETAAR